MSWTDGGHTDIDHIREFVDRWEYVKSTGAIYNGGSDSELNQVIGRPNFVTLSDNKGRYFVYEPDNDLSARKWLPEGVDGEDFIILSDHNRSSAQFSIERIGARKRMINGKMRGYHVADKLSLTLSWEDLPSRAFSDKFGYSVYSSESNADGHIKKFTADGGAGGMEMLDWYNSRVGSMWVFTSFDGIANRGVPDHVSSQGYGRIYEMFISNFDYEVNKRSRGWNSGGNVYTHDLWNVSMTLEEV